MIKGILIRVQTNPIQTLGYLAIVDGVDVVFQCKTLELPDKGNQPRVSRIPEGEYYISRTTSPSQGECYSVEPVEGRSYILIHKGNYHTDILGCILVGADFVDINGDGQLDVTSSKNTLNRMMTLVTEPFTLRIIDLNKT